MDHDAFAACVDTFLIDHPEYAAAVKTLPIYGDDQPLELCLTLTAARVFWCWTIDQGIVPEEQLGSVYGIMATLADLENREV